MQRMPASTRFANGLPHKAAHKLNNQATENHSMKIRHIIADAIGVACIFGAGYGLLLIGHGLGL